MRTRAHFVYLLGLLAISANLWAQQRCRISGTVKDRQGNPLAGARVTAENPKNMPSLLEKTTNKKGKFVFGGIKVGNWTVSARADGFLDFGQAVQLGVGQNLKMDIVLERATGAALLSTSTEKQKEIDEAKTRFDAGDFDGAIEIYEQLLRDAPDVYQIHFNLALACERKGDFQKAAEHYRQFVEKEPENFQANLNLANSLSRIGNKEGSVPYYEKCTGLEPQNAVAFYNLGLARFEIEQLGPSAEAFAKSLDLDPGLAESHFMMGNIYLRNGETGKARKSYERFLELAPDSAQADTAREALKQLKES